MKREIVKIDEDLCNGCGECIVNCPEGVLQLIDGKARMVSDLACDGLGACIGHCPVDAISIEEREAEAYDERAVMVNIVKAGENTVKAHLKHLKEHGQDEYYDIAVEYLNENGIGVPDIETKKAAHHAHSGGGCPGSRIIDRKSDSAPVISGPANIGSELKQWPVQLTLLNPHAPYFQGADLLVAADCVPFAFGNFHQRFLKDKTLVIFCPKLDSDIQGYIDKLTTIISDNEIKSITIARMEVPCCGGVTAILEEALKNSGKNIIIREYVVSLDGTIN
jgi:NAD-dependent dihydropyrimidine dehydrogenase PreA subunit